MQTSESSTQPLLNNIGSSIESTYSTASTIPNDKKHDNMQIFCKQMLKTRVFLGHYQEKRFVAGVKAYRDLIVVSSSEKNIARDFEIVRNRIVSALGSAKPLVWVGYTHSGMIGAPVGSCIWTELSDPIPFGKYWFQVKTVRFRENEVFIKLKMLRPLHASEPVEQAEHRNIFPSSTTTDDGSPISSRMSETANDVIANFSELFTVWRHSMHDNLLWLITQQITTKNMVSLIKVLFLLLVAGLTASVQSVKYLGEFTLRFMEETSKLVHVLMPLLVKCVDLLSKTIGGIYILIAMVWRDSVGGGRRNTNYRRQQEAIMQDPPPYGSFSSNMGQQRLGHQSSDYSSRYRR